MKILGIETSCDETGVAVVQKDEQTGKLKILSNVVASSLHLHGETGGIVPENAAREQLKFMLPTLRGALRRSLNYEIKSNTRPDIDAIAVTYGPGLIGSLLVGVETAKTLSYIWNIPLIPINHMHGHIYANFIRENLKIENRNSKNKVEFPAIALVVSGGHTDLLLMKDVKTFEVIGGTRDDAAGEAFDKIGRILGLTYPAGPMIAKLAQSGNHKAYVLPRPMIGSPDFDFSFSGLKTSVLYLVKEKKWDFNRNGNVQVLADLCASVQWAIVDVLVRKTIKAIQKYQAKSLFIGGGVAANEHLREKLLNQTSKLGINFFMPSKELSTDNGAMIAAAGFFTINTIPWKELFADPELYY